MFGIIAKGIVLERWDEGWGCTFLSGGRSPVRKGWGFECGDGTRTMVPFMDVPVRVRSLVPILFFFPSFYE